MERGPLMRDFVTLAVLETELGNRGEISWGLAIMAGCLSGCLR